MYRRSCASVSSPAKETRATAGLTGSATLLSASTAFWKSGCFSCRAGVRSSAGEMRKMKWADKASPRQGRWLLGELGGLAGIFAQAQTEQQDQRWQGERMNVKEPLVHDHGEVPNQTMGHCMEICTRKSCRRSTEHLGFSAYRGVWIIRQDHAIPSVLHIFSLGKTKCRFHCINSNGCITWYSTESAKYHPSDPFCI